MLFEPIIFTLLTTSDTSEDDSNNFILLASICEYVLKFLAGFTLQDYFLKDMGAILLKCNHEERLSFPISQTL